MMGRLLPALTSPDLPSATTRPHPPRPRDTPGVTEQTVSSFICVMEAMEISRIPSSALISLAPVESGEQDFLEVPQQISRFEF